MKITKNTLDHIRQQTSHTSIETGGIMGSLDGHLISEIIMDPQTHTAARCYYAPDICFFNQSIAKWQDEKTHFMGLFHTHFFNVKTLSQNDMAYITAIMQAMPDEVDQLFFPIYILPKCELICYKAIRTYGNVSIENDVLEII